MSFSAICRRSFRSAVVLLAYVSVAHSSQAVLQAEAGTDAIRLVDGKAILACDLQDVEGVVGPDGLTVRSVSPSEGTGSFSLHVEALGRESWRLPLARPGAVSATGKLARLVRPRIVEEFSASMAGIRQDFVLPQRPAGAGDVVLDLRVSGASAETADGGVTLVLPSGRRLAYHELRVTDAAGRELPASMRAAGPHTIEIRTTDLGAAYPIRIDPTVTDADWVSMGELLGTNGLVRCAEFHEGTLYVGGDFTAIQNIKANRIAAWDGSRWSALGSGMDGAVSALAFSPSGDLYAGGAFTTAGGVAANRIARWDGVGWSAMGTGLNGSASALAVDSTGLLYVGGSFSTAGGIAAKRIAKWDGDSWSTLGDGVSSGSVWTLLCDGSDNLYAGGGFTSIDGVTASNIAMWNGSIWSPVGTGRNGPVMALALDASGDLYAGGQFSYGIAKWDGAAWTRLGTGVNNGVSALVFDASGTLYLAGYFSYAGTDVVSRVAMWDGVSLSALGEGVNDYALALAYSGSGGLFVGGHFTTAGGSTARYMAVWKDAAWSVYGQGLDGTVAALTCGAGGRLYVGGEFTSTADGAASHVAEWDGSQWNALGEGVNGNVAALVCDASGNLYAGGEFTTAGGVAAKYVAKWDGENWSPVGGGTNAAVYALCFDASGSLLAGGAFTTAGGVDASRVASWDGETWSALGGGTSGTVNAFAATPGGDVYVAGGFWTVDGGTSARCIARWDGNSWSPLGTGAGSTIYALALDGSGNLYAGGTFSDIGGVSARGVAKWDGEEWSALAYGMSYSVYALAVDGAGDLYAGGDTTATGGVAINRLGKWDGSSWSALGGGLSGLGGTVRALAFDPAGDLYVGGEFGYAGDKVSPYIAKCLIPGAPDAFADTYATYRNTTLVVSAPGVLANDKDAQGDTLTATKVSDPAHGTLALAADGSFEYTPEQGYVGSDSFTYLASDGTNDSAEVTVTITVDNRAPEASADAYSTPHDVTLTVAAPGVLGNDSDADGDTLTAVVAANPTHGTLTLDADGSFTYTPSEAFVGTDSFTYKANDGLADSAAGTVTIQVLATYTVGFELGEHGTRSGGGALVQTVPHGGAATAPEVDCVAGWVFDGWDQHFGNVTSSLTVTAQYSEVEYPLVVASGSGDGDYVAGTEVAVVADSAPEGKEFAGWTVDPAGYAGNLLDASSASTTFIMPDAAVTLTATYAYTAPEWSVELTLANAFPGTLVFGMRDDATDGWDDGVDVQYPLPAAGQACLASADLLLSYSEDYHAPAETGEFMLIVSAPAGGAATVSWDLSGLPEGKFLTAYEVLLDRVVPSRAVVTRELVGNTAINLAITGSLEVPAGETRSYVLRYGDDLVFDLAIEAGWNLVSLPIEPLDPAVESVLRSPARECACDSVCTWQGTAYVSAVEMHACAAYWVHASAADVLLLAGMPANQTALVLATGGNICGVECSQSVPEDDRIVGVPWLWDTTAMRYRVATRLVPGLGYWLTVSENASIPVGPEE